MLVQHFQVTYVEEKPIVQRRLLYLISVDVLLLSFNDVFIISESRTDCIRILSLIH